MAIKIVHVETVLHSTLNHPIYLRASLIYVIFEVPFLRDKKLLSSERTVGNRRGRTQG